jgi:hypothetical protein
VIQPRQANVGPTAICGRKLRISVGRQIHTVEALVIKHEGEWQQDVSYYIIPVVADVGHARHDAAALLDDGDTRRRRRGRHRNVAVSKRASLEFASGNVIEQTAIIGGPIVGDEHGACAELAGDENISTQPCDVGQRILVDVASLKVLYGLKVGAAAAAEGAWS